jgi:hypothetical protein
VDGSSPSGTASFAGRSVAGVVRGDAPAPGSSPASATSDVAGAAVGGSSPAGAASFAGWSVTGEGAADGASAGPFPGVAVADTDGAAVDGSSASVTVPAGGGASADDTGGGFAPSAAGSAAAGSAAAGSAAAGSAAGGGPEGASEAVAGLEARASSSVSMAGVPQLQVTVHSAAPWRNQVRISARPAASCWVTVPCSTPWPYSDRVRTAVAGVSWWKSRLSPSSTPARYCALRVFLPPGENHVAVPSSRSAT